MNTRAEKPLGIVIIAWASIVIGALDIVGSILMAVRGDNAAALVPFTLTAGGVLLGLGFALRAFERWVLYLTFGYFGILGLAGLFSGHWIVALVAASVVAYFCTPKVRRAFSLSNVSVREGEQPSTSVSQQTLFRGLPASSKAGWPVWLPKSAVAVIALALCGFVVSLWVFRRYSILGTWTYREGGNVSVVKITQTGDGQYQLVETSAGLPFPFQYDLRLEHLSNDLYVGNATFGSQSYPVSLRLEDGKLTCECGTLSGTWTASRP